MWIFLSLLSGFGQALSWALKKKTLENRGVNNTLGLISYATAGVLLVLVWGWQDNFISPEITSRFMFATVMVVSLNVLAAWAGYKALDQAGFSKLMPFIALTSLSIIPVEYVIRGVLPSAVQLVGMFLVVVGAIVFSVRERLGKETLVAVKYFSVTLICYSISSPYMAVMVDESSSGLFSAGVAHIGIALGFLIMVLFSYEYTSIRELQAIGEWRKILLLMIIAGAVIAFLENGPINVALETANASEVFALKRTMPFFALILGIFMFNERVEMRHVVGTIFLVAGSVLVVWFR